METGDQSLERAEKQEFLLENIVTPGYRRESFAAFISTQKENGSDIDNWTFEELKQVVLDFQDSYKEPLTPEKGQDDSYDGSEAPELFGDRIKENNDIQNQPSEEEYAKEYDHIDLSAEGKENNNDEGENGQENEGVVKASICDFEDTTKISDQTAFNKITEHCIEITDAVHNPGGLFSFSYVEYYIDTQPFGWSVTRREQDFKRLREYLLKKYPQFIIPPMIQNKLFEMQADKDTKKVYFQEFLREITTNPEL